MNQLENCHPPAFYNRLTQTVGKELIGSLLCRRLPDGSIISGRIVETEAYRQNDPACHAFRGPTPRCQVLFGPPGISYVYFIYGSYHCLNVVTEPLGRGCAVLIRAVEGENTNGPGKLCRQLAITRLHNGLDLTDPQSDIWIARGQRAKSNEIGISTRIGIKVGEELKWRYFLIGHPDVSGPKALNQVSTNRPNNRSGNRLSK